MAGALAEGEARGPGRWLCSRAAHLALVVAATGLVYANSTSAPFVSDDFPGILHNPAVADLGLLADADRVAELPLPQDLKTSLRSRTFGYLTFALNHLVHGFDPAGFRLVNIAVHATNSCLVYLLAASLLSRARRRARDTLPPPTPAGGSWAALVAALLFAVHPLHTNAVTYVIQRFTSLATLLYLLALVTYLKARSSASARVAAGYLTVSLVATALAMDTKEIAFTLPIAISVAELMFHVGPMARRALYVAPYLTTMLIIPVTLWSAVPAEATTSQKLVQVTDLMNLDQLPRASYLFTQFRVIVTYLRMLLFPVGLNFDHDYPVYHDFLALPVVASFVALAGFLTLGVVLLARSRRPGDPAAAHLRVAAFGIFFFFIAISMSSSVIPINDVINEYRVYLPSVGLDLFLVSAGAALLHARSPATSRRRLAWTAVACAASIGAFASATVARNRIWQDALVFWQDAGAKSPGKVRVAWALSAEYMARGMPDAAVATLRTLIDRNPRLGKPHFLLGDVYLAMGRFDDALAEFTRARAVRSDKAEIHVGLTRAYLGLGRRELAAESLERAAALEPGNAALAPLRALLGAPREVRP